MFTLIKRASLFLTVNFLMITTLSLILGALSTYLGIDFGSFTPMIIIYAIIGFGGSFVSLMISRYMAKKSMKVQLIEPGVTGAREKWLLDTVYTLAHKAGMKVMPEVGIYPGQEVNAFATGPSKNKSLVAVSEGLLANMDKEEVEGVLAHEIAHIVNGDMVTMTLVQGVINTIVLIASRLIAQVVTSRMERGQHMAYMGIYYGVSIVLSLLGSIVVSGFSRYREFKADRGGAQLAGPPKMIKALEKLQSAYGMINENHQEVAALKISGRSKPSFIARLLSTHPPLEDRIQRLKAGGLHR